MNMRAIYHNKKGTIAKEKLKMYIRKQFVYKKITQWFIYSHIKENIWKVETIV